jgi:hypothetical protein
MSAILVVGGLLGVGTWLVTALITCIASVFKARNTNERIFALGCTRSLLNAMPTWTG